MLVYRLEKNDRGVFDSYESGVKLSMPPDAIYENYGCTITKAKYDSNYRFGCESAEKLVEYFGSDFDKVLAQDAELVVYKVHKRNVIFSKEGIEVAFEIAKAERVSV